MLSIYRVPKCLHEGNEKAYTPHTISLGPYHHGRFPEMNHHKWRAVYHILERTEKDIEFYLDSVEVLEERARACYEGPCTLTKYQFVEMMVLDGCFILELFQGVAKGFQKLGYSPNDPIFTAGASLNAILRDMLMLENQIPLFILDHLLGLQSDQPDQKGLVAELAVRFFHSFIPTYHPLAEKSCLDVFRRIMLGKGPKPDHCVIYQSDTSQPVDPLADQSDLHCLDVFRRRLLGEGHKTDHSLTDQSQTNQLIHCVTELIESGITIKRKNTDRFWDITFKNGVLEIPPILIHDGTESLFLNLIAFEQCRLDRSSDIISYVMFMDSLINSPADVKYLHYHGIIENWLGSDVDVADLFNRLCQEVVEDMDNNYLTKLSMQVNKYCNRRCNAWRASLMHNYFNNPWTIISFVAAMVLLFLTFTQTFYAVYGYYRPPS